MSFLDLPAELRNDIYSLILPTSDSFGVNDLATKPHFPVVSKKSTSMLRTCRQIHAETTPILYGSNTFHIWTQDVPLLLLQIGQSARFLRTICIEHDSDAMLMLALLNIQHLTQLKCITLRPIPGYSRRSHPETHVIDGPTIPTYLEAFAVRN